MSAVVKFIDNPADVVQSAIDGVCMVDSSRQRLANSNVVVATDVDPTKVALVCGGGSGHEPAHVGFVARGWLSAAVCGSVFASPPTAHVSAAIEYLAKKQGYSNNNTHDQPGILVIIKNYAGDVLNFEFAVRQAQEQGIRVESVLSADDAVFGTEETSKRRGVAGTCLLYKILGAAAADGASLEQLKALAGRVSRNMRSIGASLSSCALPGCPPSSTLPQNTVEIGLGIHGEKGLLQAKFKGAHALATMMINILMGRRSAVGSDGASESALGGKAPPLPHKAKMLLMVNNLGSTTDMEMSILTAHALRLLASEGFDVIGTHTGRHMTALDMHGFSYTVLAVEEAADVAYMLNTTDLQEGFIQFNPPVLKVTEAPGPLTALQIAKQQHREAQSGASALYASTKRVFESLLSAEAYFNELDAEVGDGDLGSGVERASRAALELLPYLPWERDVARTFTLLAKAVADACAGTSGPLYGALLIGAGTGAHKALEAHPSSGAGQDKERVSVQAIRAAIAQGSDEVQKLGGAHQGDRTMVDVLEAMRQSPQVQNATTLRGLWQVCSEEATKAAAATAQLPAKFGRSRYLGGKEVGKKDPGAELVVYWVNTLLGKNTTHHVDKGK